MKILGLILTIIATITCVQAQVTTEIKSDAQTTVMLSIRNLVDGIDEDWRPEVKECMVSTYTGTIVKVHYDKKHRVNIDGFTLLVKPMTGRSRKGVVHLQGHEGLPPSELRWLGTLIATGNRVRVDAYLCGHSGSHEVVNNVIALSVKKASLKRKK